MVPAIYQMEIGLDDFLYPAWRCSFLVLSSQFLWMSWTIVKDSLLKESRWSWVFDIIYVARLSVFCLDTAAPFWKFPFVLRETVLEVVFLECIWSDFCHFTYLCSFLFSQSLMVTQNTVSSLRWFFTDNLVLTKLGETRRYIFITLHTVEPFLNCTVFEYFRNGIQTFLEITWNLRKLSNNFQNCGL